MTSDFYIATGQEGTSSSVSYAAEFQVLTTRLNSGAVVLTGMQIG